MSGARPALLLVGLVLLAAGCRGKDKAPTEPDGFGPSYAAVGAALTTAQVEMGQSHSCAVSTAGTVTCWGDNSLGQTDVPATLGPVLQVSSILNHTCAVRAKRDVRCWGGPNTYGQLNPPADLGPVLEVSAGEHHTCALRLDRTVRCWGEIVTSLPYPFVVPAGLTDAIHLTSGPNYACAVRKTGAVACWGDPDDGESDVPPGLNDVVGAYGGYEQPCVVRRGGLPFCWGQGWFPSVTNPPPNVDSPTLNQIPAGLSSVTKVGGGNGRTCALRNDGALFCWTGSTDHLTLAELQVPDLPTITAFDFHRINGGYCAVTAAGEVRCSSGANGGVPVPAGLQLN